MVRSMLARALLFWIPPERVQEFIDAQQKRKVGSKKSFPALQSFVFLKHKILF